MEQERLIFSEGGVRAARASSDLGGDHFTNRHTATSELVSDLRSGQSVLVISPRRYGKTSLITAVIDKIRS